MGPSTRSLGWLVLCAALAAGLAWWSLYLVGLVFLLIAALGLSGVPPSRRMRRATTVAMLVGFEGSMACLVALYWFAWYQRSGGFYLYLAILAGLGLVIVGAVLLLRSRPSTAAWNADIGLAADDIHGGQQTSITPDGRREPPYGRGAASSFADVAGTTEANKRREPRTRMARLKSVWRWASGYKWPIWRVPVGSVGVMPDWRSPKPAARAVLSSGWRFASAGYLRIVPDHVDTGQLAVPGSSTQAPVCWVSAVVVVTHPDVAAFAVADVRAAVSQQMLVAVRNVSLTGSSGGPEEFANKVRVLVGPTLDKWGMSVTSIHVGRMP